MRTSAASLAIVGLAGAWLAVAAAADSKAAADDDSGERQSRGAYGDALEAGSYALVFIVFAAFVRISKSWVDDAEYPPEGSTWCFWLAGKCSSENHRAYEPVSFANGGPSEEDERERKEEEERAASRCSCESLQTTAMKLVICVLGIQVSFICWGIMQETIMTTPYGGGRLFTSSKFLVFANQFIALFLGLAISKWQEARGQPPVTLPLYRFSYCAATNVMSSASQLEALKYVSFPLQARGRQQRQQRRQAAAAAAAAPPPPHHLLRATTPPPHGASSRRCFPRRAK